MNLRQKSSRYNAAVMFLAGVAGASLVAAVILNGFQTDIEIWLATALVASLILHARAGFALSRAQQELELLRGQVKKFVAAATKDGAPPVIKFEAPPKTPSADAEILNRVREAIEEDRIDLYLQPIVSLPQRKQRYYEAFSRLRNADGTILQPAHYLEAAERANRIGLIDNMILLRAVQALRTLGDKSDHTRIFCNLSPATIFDNAFFEKFTDYLDSNSDLAHRLVFEFTYPSVEMMNETVQRNLASIARRGYSFSVDHIRRFDLNWRALREKNFRFVKASSALLLHETRGDPASRDRVRAFKQTLMENGIDLIVEKVETETSVPEILALGIDYGQGELFGAPRPAAAYVKPAEPALAIAS